MLVQFIKAIIFPKNLPSFKFHMNVIYDLRIYVVHLFSSSPMEGVVEDLSGDQVVQLDGL